MKHILSIALVLALSCSALYADLEPRVEATARWGASAWINVHWNARTDQIVYQVGFYTIFGPIAVGAGDSWESAFQQADERIQQRIRPPLHGPGEF